MLCVWNAIKKNKVTRKPEFEEKEAETDSYKLVIPCAYRGFHGYRSIWVPLGPKLIVNRGKLNTYPMGLYCKIKGKSKIWLLLNIFLVKSLVFANFMWNTGVILEQLHDEDICDRKLHGISQKQSPEGV